MNRFKNYYPLIIFLVYSAGNLVFSEGQFTIEPWKIDLQILLGFSDDKVDGVMGQDTFEALKLFAKEHDLTDVVLRGDYDDLGFWGFQQYIIKYNQYWVRELKNHTIIEDVLNKEYLRQADETLYSFEMAIQNAQLEVERLTRAKSKARRSAREKQEMDKWQVEKQEAERIINSLSKALITAEEEAEKWTLERIRAKRLADEQEQLLRLDERKVEAALLTSELEDVIILAKREIDRLAEENNNLKTLITTTTDTRHIAEELKAELHLARLQMDSLYTRKITGALKAELQATRMQIDSLSIQKDSLEKILEKIEVKVAEKYPQLKKKWYTRIWPFGKK